MNVQPPFTEIIKKNKKKQYLKQSTNLLLRYIRHHTLVDYYLQFHFH